MKDFICATLSITPYSEDASDLLAAWLGDIGFDSFTPQAPNLLAYIDRNLFSASALEAALAEFPMPGVTIHSSISLIEGEDWNAEWEKHYFRPIVIGGQCVVHSSFHTNIPRATYDITVDPKMAFGTGHHSTTSLMLSYILTTDVKGKTIIDMGTGTGILAILASMRGAHPIFGIEIDPDAAINARENVALNHADVEIITGDASALTSLPKADIFLANINRNIITSDIPLYAHAMKPGAQIALSGFYSADIPIIEAAATAAGLKKNTTRSEKDDWTIALFTKPINP